MCLVCSPEVEGVLFFFFLYIYFFFTLAERNCNYILERTMNVSWKNYECYVFLFFPGVKTFLNIIICHGKTQSKNNFTCSIFSLKPETTEKHKWKSFRCKFILCFLYFVNVRLSLDSLNSYLQFKDWEAQISSVDRTAWYTSVSDRLSGN